LIRHGVTGVFVNGSTGESLSLTVEERRKLAQKWVEAAGDQLRVLVHVGHNAMYDAVELACHAAEIGADSISAMAPTIFRPKCIDDLIGFLEPIAAAAPATPFYFYHIPSLSRVDVCLDEFLKKASRRIPTLAGVKYTHSNLVEYGQCQSKWSPQYELLFGKDELMLPALTAGAAGFIGTSYNFVPNSFTRVIDAFSARNMEQAQEWMVAVNRFVLLMVDAGYLTYGKRLLSFLGVECGEARPPLPRSANDVLERLLAAISDLPLADSLRRPTPRPAHRGQLPHQPARPLQNY
jgi:N-acetylneuraminate lyase